jgi:hypothetical protein
VHVLTTTYWPSYPIVAAPLPAVVRLRPTRHSHSLEGGVLGFLASLVYYGMWFCCVHPAAAGGPGGVHGLLQRQVQGPAEADVAAHPGALRLTRHVPTRALTLPRCSILFREKVGCSSIVVESCSGPSPFVHRVARSWWCPSSRPRSCCSSTRKVIALLGPNAPRFPRVASLTSLHTCLAPLACLCRRVVVHRHRQGNWHW